MMPSGLGLTVFSYHYMAWLPGTPLRLRAAPAADGALMNSWPITIFRQTMP